MGVVIIEPASSGLDLLQAARALGELPIVFTGVHGERDAIARVCEGSGARVVETDTNDLAVVLEAVENIRGDEEIRAVLPGMEYYVGTAATVAQALGLPGIGADIALRFRNKYVMRRRLAEKGIAVPRFAEVVPERLDTIMRNVGFPAVLKPIDACGSLGVQRVDDMVDLEQRIAGLRTARLTDMGHTFGCRLMIESYVDGPEFSLEGVITTKGPRVVAVTQKTLGPEPYFVEVGHIVPANMAPEERETITAYTEAAVERLGLSLGVFHAEVRVGSEGPVLIEVAARLGGDRIPLLVKLAHDVSLPALSVMSHCGGPVAADNLGVATTGLVAGIQFSTEADIPPSASALTWSALRTLEGFIEAKFEAAPVRASHVARDFRDRIGYVVLAAADHAALHARFRRAETILHGRSPRRTSLLRDGR